MKSKISNVIILTISIFNFVFSQNFNLSGYVKDSKSLEPLVGANVFIKGTSIGTSTNETGSYELKDLKVGQYIIKASYIGYSSFEDTLIITDGNINLDFNLNYTTIEGQEVLVTAQAKGQLDAINKQLNSRSIVNIVSSDRIQELPDANAAETVARIPGVSIKREGGEGNKVVIRGLSPKYNSITVDGTKLASTDSDDRSTDLSMISQNVLEGIEVTKAGTPNLDADVLGGTINFKLKRAKPGFHATAIAQGIHNDLRNSYNDNKLVLDMSNRFFEDRVGIFAQIDLENRNRSSNALGAFYNNAGAVEVDSLNQLTLTSFNLYNIDRINDRQNSLAVIDINIPNGNISYSNLNSGINKDVNSHRHFYELTNNERRLRSGTDDNIINVSTETWKYKQNLFSKFDLEAYRSYSKSDNTLKEYQFNFHERFAFSESVLGKNLDKIQNFASNDTLGTYWNDYQYFKYNTKESEETFGLDLEYAFRLSNILSGKVKIGNKIRTKSRNFDQNHEFGNVAAAAGLREPRDSLIQHFPEIQEYSPVGTRTISLLNFKDSEYDYDGYKIGDYSFGPVADLDYMMEAFKFFKTNFHKYAPGASTIDEYIMHHIHQTNSIFYDYNGEEEYRASYSMIDLDIGAKVNVIAGLRQENNTTTYTAYRAQRSALTHWVFTGEEFTYQRKNSYTLPALFLRYKPVEWLNIRAALTNTLTRPNYTDIIPLQEFQGTASAVDWRNQDLKPGKSKNQDYSISFNQNRLGLISIGYFTKNIEDLIFSSGRRYIDDPSEFGLPENVEKWQLLNYTSNNPYDVLLKGIEFDYQTRFWYLPSFLSGLVLNFNYTTIESEVKYPRSILDQFFDWDASPPGVITTVIDTFYTDRLIDQPNEIMNLSLGYDYKGFSGRISMLYKTDVFTQTNFWPELRKTTDDYRRWDLSIKQKLPAKGLEIFFNANNLTEATDVDRFRGSTSLDNSIGSLAAEQYYGKTFDLGFRYSF